MSIQKLIEKAAFVSLAAGISSLVVLQQVDAKPTPSTLQTERLEIVDKNGNPCLVLAASKHGGSITIRRPSRGEGPEEVIGFIGSMFENDIQFYLKDPSPGGKSALSMAIAGEPSYPTIGGLGVAGTPRFSLGGNGTEDPKLRLWRQDSKDPYFSK